jgi:hypothetical protein
MPVRVEERKRQLIEGLVIARSKVMEAARAIPASQAEEQFLGVWSIKDLVAHLIGWDYTNLQAVKEIMNGQPPTFFQYFDKDWGSYNRRLVAQYIRGSLDELLVDAETSHLHLVGYLETLTARDIVHGKAGRENGRSTTVRNLLQAETRDELKHAEQILRYLEIQDGA